MGRSGHTGSTKGGAVSFGVLALASFISLLVLSGLELGSAIVRWKIRPIREAVLPVSCEPLEENDGRLVHIDCPIKHMHPFPISSAFRPNLPKFKGVFFETRAEMFQSTLSPGAFRSAVKGVWSDHIVSSQSRNRETHTLSHLLTHSHTRTHRHTHRHTQRYTETQRHA